MLKIFRVVRKLPRIVVINLALLIILIVTANILYKYPDFGATHYSYRNTREYFDRFFKSDWTKECKKSDFDGAAQTRGVFVPHHMLVGFLDASTLDFIKCLRPRDTVIISPNHFNAGQSNVIYSRARWKTPYGTLDPDFSPVDNLRSVVGRVDESPFENEHGISSIVPFIAHSSPTTRVIPIILKDKTSDEDIDKLAQQLDEVMPSDTVFVGSIDFSHYLPSRISELHDTTSINVIQNFDFDGIKRLEVDSQPSVRLMMKVMQLRGYTNFILNKNTNSDTLLSTPESFDNTSYITGTFTKLPEPKNKDIQQTVTIQAFGDIMLDRFIRQKISQAGFVRIFKGAERLFLGSDLTIGNLEGIFSTNPPKPVERDNLNFEFDPKLISEIKKLGINLVSLANNHSLNSGSEAFAISKDLMKEGNLSYFGDPSNYDQVSIIKEIRGMKLCFVGFNEFTGGEISNIMDAISKCKTSANFTIIYPHWGTEYSEFPSEKQQSLAHEFINAGADLIIGSHPHVIQTLEIYNSKPIFYSLGNFIFDDGPSDLTNIGLSLGIVLNKDKTISIRLNPFSIKHMQFSLLTKESFKSILRQFSNRSNVKPEVKEMISNGILNLKL